MWMFVRSYFKRNMFSLPYIFGMISRERHQVNSPRFYEQNSVKITSQKITGRPPNILIYTGLEDRELFETTKELVKQCLDQDKYVIYRLKDELIFQEPWRENTELLILASDVQKCHERYVDSYVENGGKLLSFCSCYTLNNAVQLLDVSESAVYDILMSDKLARFNKSWRVNKLNAAFEVVKGQSAEVLAVSSPGSQPIIVNVSHGDGRAILSQISIQTLVDHINADKKELLTMLLMLLGMTCGSREKSILTNAYLLGDEKDKEVFLKSFQDVLTDNCFKGNDINIYFNSENNELVASDKSFPVITTINEGQVSFATDLYKDHLKTKHLGQLVIYTEVITSTQTILNGSLKLVSRLPDGYGLVLVANQQTVGKGRGGNDWLSPDGCLSFSFPLHIDLDSNLGHRLPFVQHIAALAVVDAVRSAKGYEDIDLRIKWPNDIYFGKTTKIGGILVNSSIQGRCLYAVIGIGVNLDNSEPTTCINDMIEQSNVEMNARLKKLHREQLLARILNEMENLVHDFQIVGAKPFLEKYYLRWLHSEAKVIIGNESGEEVAIKGLDDMGFLSVTNSLNEVQSLQPDGNSFDMLRNLITTKPRN